MAIVNKVIIVEGKSDKKRVQQVIAEPVNIICTHGTMSIDKLDDMIESLYDKQVFVLADSDDEGDRIRNWFKRYLSESEHIFIAPNNIWRMYFQNMALLVRKKHLFYRI